MKPTWREHRATTTQIATLEEAGPGRPRISESIGQRLSVVVSTAISGIALLINFLVFAIL